MVLIFAVLGVLGVYGVFSACWMFLRTLGMFGRVMMLGDVARGRNEAPLVSVVGQVEHDRWVAEAVSRYEESVK